MIDSRPIKAAKAIGITASTGAVLHLIKINIILNSNAKKSTKESNIISIDSTYNFIEVPYQYKKCDYPIYLRKSILSFQNQLIVGKKSV